MKEDKIVNGYYESKIKTSRKEDSVYAIKYASQQMLIDKLESNWKELKEQLENYTKRSIDNLNMDLYMFCEMVLDKMQELETNK